MYKSSFKFQISMITLTTFQIDFEVRMTGDLEVIDPDNGDASGSSSLSSKLLLVNEEGHLKIDCLTLDEKLMWLQALGPWSRNFYSCQFRKVGASNVGGSDLNISNKQNHMSSSGESTPISEKKKSRNPFKAATKGMMRAFSLTSSKSSTPPSSHASGSNPSPMSVKGSPGSRIQVDITIKEKDVKSTIPRDVRGDPIFRTSFSPAFKDIISNVESLRIPLVKYTALVEDTESYSIENIMETTRLLQLSQESVASMVTGLCALNVISNEVSSAI